MKTNDKNGITLIALVITIVILLILAGVSIAMLTGNNGILTQAKNVKENTQVAKKDEENKLASNNNYINEQLGNAVPGKVVTETKKDNYVDSNGDKATIPAGFTISKIAEEQNVANGLVIYDIPENEIRNVDWTTKNEDGAYNVQTLYNQFVWIPEVAESEYQRNLSYQSYYCINDDWILSETTPTNSTMTDTNYLPNVIQPKIDNETAERNAVLKYNGFYIARYEAGKNLNDKVQNIYDLEGNCVEYVAEKNDCKEFQFIGRGGSYYYGNIGNNASRRFAGVGVATQDRTFRPVLYII